ncbi:MAG: hypothetical protein P8K76_15440 [Candidatus Binatia bacterium]|nr:hypothetical protein [Candidatus Binatia bacterium]MDG2011160.1 hypothetical protein [Candidatus Binatia bacterium]
MNYRKTARFLPFVAFFGLSVGSILSAPASVVAQSLQATLENSNLQRFAGKATRAGDMQRDGSVKFEMRLDASSLSGLDLTRLPFLHFADLLLDTDGTSLVSTDGLDMTLHPMEARRGARATLSRYQLPGRDRSGARAEVQIRNGVAKVKVKISRARITPPESCRLGAETADLRSRLRLSGSDSTNVEIDVTHAWHCKTSHCSDAGAGCFDLRALSRSSSGSSGNRKPTAKLDVKNLTRSETEQNWIRLDSTRSEDRDGRIVSHRLDLFRKQGRELVQLAAPSTSTAKLAHARLGPGDYTARLVVTDDQGLHDTDERRFSVRGKSITIPAALGTPWAMGENWQPGGEYTILTRGGGPIDFGEIVSIFAEATNPGLQTSARSGAFGLGATAAQNTCGSAGSKTGLALNIVGGIVLGAASIATMGGADVAAGALALGGTALQMGSTSASTAGGNQASSCVQEEIDNLSDEVELQAIQIQAIQNQLNLTDEAFYNDWMATLNTGNDLYRSNYYTQLNAFSPTDGDPTAACASDDGTCGACQAPNGSSQVSLNGPSPSCALSSGGIVGDFFYNAGLWTSQTGGAIPNLCNQQLQFDGAASCEPEQTLQSGANFNKLSAYINGAVEANFLGDLASLTGTDVTGIGTCTADCWQNVGKAGPDELWPEVVESLYQTTLGSSGKAYTMLKTPALAAQAQNSNVIAVIDAYNRSLVQYVQLAATAIVQGFQMEWMINNFNYYATTGGGSVSTMGPSIANAQNVPSLVGSDGWAGWYPGSIQATNLAKSCTDWSEGGGCAVTSDNVVGGDSTSFYAGAWVCKNTKTYCAPEDWGFVEKGGSTNCQKGSGCKYAYCNGQKSSCAYGGKGIKSSSGTSYPPAEADIAAYNQAQYTLALVYAERLNVLYQLFLAYLVTDTPTQSQSWPTTSEGVCTSGAATTACGRSLCKVKCSADSDCGTGGTCATGDIGYDSITTSAGWMVPATQASRSPEYISRPLGLLSRNTPTSAGAFNKYFDTPSQHPSDPYDPSGMDCAADYKTSTGELVSSGQPGWIDSLEYVCPEEYPYCTGYYYGVQWGQCSSRKPWTADSVLYQYPLLDLGTCQANRKAYNATQGTQSCSGGSTPGAACTVDSDCGTGACETRPTIGGAWGAPGQCPSVFATADGGAPRYGYYDGRTVQPYSFLVGDAARDAQTANLRVACGRLDGTWDDTTAVCSDLTSAYAENACANYGGTWDGTTDTCSPPSACPSSCSEASCAAPPAGWTPSELPGCGTYEAPYQSSSTSPYNHATFVTTDPTTGSQCSQLLFPTDGGPCTGFCTTDTIEGVTPELTGACVDASYAMANGILSAPASLTDCQGCADQAVLALLAPMRGNLGESGTGCAGSSFTEGPQLTLYRPDDVRTDLGINTDGENPAMLCKGCVYLACGNYSGLDMNTSQKFGVWPLFPATGLGSVFPGGSTDGFCQNNTANKPSDQPCAVGSLLWKSANADSAISIVDYRAQTGWASGFDQADLKFENQNGPYDFHYGQWFNSTGPGENNWGAGVLQMGSLGKNSGSDAGTNVMNLSYRLQNPAMPVATDDPGSETYGLFAWQGQDIGFQIIGQNLTGSSCPNNTDQISVKDNIGYCLSLATAVTSIDMDTYGYGCESAAPENSGWGTPTYGTKYTNYPSDKPLGSPQDNGLKCITNDGRSFDVQALMTPGGTLNQVQNERYYYSNVNQNYMSGTLYFTDSQQKDWANNPPSDTNVPPASICPAGCLNALYSADGTNGAMPLLETSGACTGFVSGWGYCGGYCYAQPDGDYGSGVAPLDCRGCLDAYYEEFTQCPSDYPFAYQGGGELGSYCCEYIPYSSGSYADPSIMDHCPENSYTPCPDTSKKCVSYSAPKAQYVLPATNVSGESGGDGSCFPSGNGALISPFPWPY